MKYYEKPVQLIGKIVGVRDHWFRLDQGRGMVIELCVDDFYEVFDGAVETMTLLLDAGLNNDVVKIALSASRLSYDNAKQIERLKTFSDEESTQAAAVS